MRILDADICIDEIDEPIGPFSKMLVVSGLPVGPINISIHRMNLAGPTAMFQTWNFQPDHNRQWRSPCEGLPDDLYVLSIVAPTDPTIDLFDGTPFRKGAAVNPIENLGAAVREAVLAQNDFRNREIRAPEFQGDRKTEVMILIEGCLLDYEQFIEGAVLKPLPQKVSGSGVYDAVNCILAPLGITMDFSGLAQNYESARPLCTLTFVNIQAPDATSAIGAIQSRVHRTLAALAEDRSCSPHILAYIVHAGEDWTVNLPHDVYRGNLIPGFGAGAASLVEFFTSAAEKDPWIDFAMQLLRSARSQKNPDTQLFVAWSLIEAAAKRVIPKSGAVVMTDQGVPLTSARGNITLQQDVGRVLVYMRDHVFAHPVTMAPASTAFFGRVLAVYRARNMIAHEGGASVPGKPAPAGYTSDMISEILDWAGLALRRECRRSLTGT
jgi:hypothetical protein